jgi:hypothetical protein
MKKMIVILLMGFLLMGCLSAQQKLRNNLDQWMDCLCEESQLCRANWADMSAEMLRYNESTFDPVVWKAALPGTWVEECKAYDIPSIWKKYKILKGE